MTRAPLFISVSGLFVAAAIIAGLWTITPPHEQYIRNVDKARVQDISFLSSAITQFFNKNGHLPSSLIELEEKRLPSEPSLRLADPMTKEKYEYRTTAELGYQLCAEFGLSSASSVAQFEMWNPNTWKHEAGQQCFSLNVTPRK